MVIPKDFFITWEAPKPNGGWMVFDVWESAGDFQTFGNTLMPLIQKNNIQPVPPLVYEAHNIYYAGKSLFIITVEPLLKK